MGLVLIVDDSADTLRVMSLFLTRAGHRIQIASSVAQALERVHEELPDVALVDLMMPNESGVDLLCALRSEPRTRELPVIIYSAVSERRYVRQAMQAGATDYWLKGTLRPGDLHERLQPYLPNVPWHHLHEARGDAGATLPTAMNAPRPGSAGA